MVRFDEDEYNSDDEIDKKQHARLLDDVLQLDQRPYVKKPARTEPATHVSEFNLVKSSKSSKNAISINDLTKSLSQKSKHVGIGKKVKTAQKVHTLHKPAEKPQAERIRRAVGFKKTKYELNKWNSIVEKNRVASQITFPLNQDEVYFIDSKTEKTEPVKRYKSKLDLALEKLEPKVEVIHAEEKFPLSMQEIMERRKEMASIRAHQSYQEAKAHRKNKIKSKTYHRIQRKEKLKKQINQFEILQKTDPEEALRKLEQLEKTRAEERMTLRHRSTGQWAKSKQVRAKYDKDSRQALAQQLSLSHELTRKLKNDESSDSELDVEMSQKQKDSSNPWISAKPTEIDNFVSGYRKYWNEQNQKNISGIQQENNPEVDNVADEILETFEEENSNKNENLPEKFKISTEKNDIKKEKKKKLKSNKSKKKSLFQVTHCNSSWTVTSLAHSENEENCKISKKQDIDDIFENLEDTVRSKAKEKIIALQKFVKTEKKQKLQIDFKDRDHKTDLVFPREKEMRPELDDELKNYDFSEDEESNDIETLKKTANDIVNNNENKLNNSNIDPNKYMKAKSKVKVEELDSQLPNISHADDNSDSSGDDYESQKQYISEAFADDDVVNDFSKEKKQIIDADKSKDIDLTLPGWGSWGGKNLKPSKRKRKRFIIKMPKEMPRRDQNKGNLIINEHKNKEIQKCQVSDMPFPFTTVKDFEASIRAPIGDTFVPQTAFRRLIKPSVKTKKGAIIEPMTGSVLLKQKFTQNGFLINKK